MRRCMDRSALTAVAALAAISLAGVAFAQQRTQPARGQQPQTAGEAAPARQAAPGPQVGDREFASWICYSNLVGLEVAQLAQQQAQTQEVKGFAEKLVNMYKGFNQQVQEAAPGLRLPPRLTVADRPAAQPAARPAEPGQPERREVRGFRPGDAGKGEVGLVQLHNELAEQMARSMIQSLGQKKGVEFDKAFLGGQIVMCMQMADALEVFQKHAQSPELQRVFAEGAEGARKLVREGEQLAQQLEQPASR